MHPSLTMIALTGAGLTVLGLLMWLATITGDPSVACIALTGIFLCRKLISELEMLGCSLEVDTTRVPLGPITAQQLVHRNTKHTSRKTRHRIMKHVCLAKA